MPLSQVLNFATAAENAAGTVEGSPVDPLGLREAFNATGTAPVYACRAWVRFNVAAGVPAVVASGNVSSITDNAVGDFTVNFTVALADGNYAMSGSAKQPNDDGHGMTPANVATPFVAGSARVYTTSDTGVSSGGALADPDFAVAAFFR